MMATIVAQSKETCDKINEKKKNKSTDKNKFWE